MIALEQPLSKKLLWWGLPVEIAGKLGRAMQAKPRFSKN